MSNDEKQIRATDDRQLSASKQQRVEILSSVAPDSRLHQIVHNPTQEGMGEG